MFIDFKKEAYWGAVNFFASIKYNEIHPDCNKWLDLEKNILSYPKIFKNDNFINCSWVITKTFGCYVSLYFDYIEVITDHNQ